MRAARTSQFDKSSYAAMRSRAAGSPLLAAALLAAVAWTGCAVEAPEDLGGWETVDSVLTAWTQDGRIPGAVAYVSVEGRPFFHRAYGYGQVKHMDPGWDVVDLVDPLPMDTTWTFDLASLTKVLYTTYGAMFLVDDGLLDLDAPIQETLPDFRGEDKERVTARHLLSHASGIRPWWPLYYHADSREGALAVIDSMPLVRPPGQARVYSDLGFMVLESLLDTKAPRGLQSLVERRLYEPLQLDGTDFGLPGFLHDRPFAPTSHGNPYERKMIEDPNFGYEYTGDPEGWSGWRDYTLISQVNDGNAYHAFGRKAGHAGLFSTAKETAMLVEPLLAAGNWRGLQLVSPVTVRTFLMEQLQGQALGWWIPAVDFAPEGSFYHTGFTGVFAMGIPACEAAIAILTNRQNVGVDGLGRYPDTEVLEREATRGVLAALRRAGRC